MHRVIIAVDFSESSLKAARFAAQMLAGKKDTSAMLYHNYETEDDRDHCVQYLESLKNEFLNTGVHSVELEFEMGGELIDNITRLVQSFKATLVVAGIKSKSVLEQTIFGNNTLKLVDKNLYPVLIVPPNAVYHGINNVAFTSDFINIEATTPSVLINAVLEMFDPMLHIVNVNSEHYVSLTDEIREGKEKIKKLFVNYKTEFYFIAMNDFQEAIDNFIRDYKIDILITIPKHEANSFSFFKTPDTRHLAYNSDIPILAAHE